MAISFFCISNFRKSYISRVTKGFFGAIRDLKLVEVVFYGIFAIFLIFSAILLAGFVQIVFYDWTPPEIYTYYLASVIGESIALLFLYIRNVAGLREGVKKVMVFDTNKKINDYMLNLISSGSSLDIVSGTLSWVSEDDRIRQKMIERAKNAEINIYLPKKNKIATLLENNGVSLHISPSLAIKQFARFTLVDRNNPGSSMLAVGCGILPHFTISEFDPKSNAQVVTLAQNYLEIL